MTEGWEPSTDLSHRIGFALLAAGGEEFRGGLFHLAFLLFHYLL